jgi:hypothetical protein
MTQHRKPIPKSQKEIANDLVNPYINPETGETLGNSNTPQNYKQFTKKSQKGVDFNRGEKLSQKGDTHKQFTVNLQDVDEAIMYYFDNVIQPYVFQNGERIKVPLLYGTPERFKTIQKDGFLRDKNGKEMMPLAVFKRDNVEKNRSITRKLDANDPKLYTFWQKTWNQKNSYSNFNVLNNKIPTKQFIANVVPDYVTLTYSFIVQTYYVEQLNKIVEAINYASDSYWGDPERFKFKARIDSFATTTEMNQGENRIVRSTFTLKVHGYIVPDVLQKDVKAIKKYNSKSKVTFGIETIDNPLEFFSPSLQTSTPITPQFPSGGGGGSITPQVLTYLNTNIQKLGDYVDPTTVTFNSGWLAAPSGLPPTSLNNFSIFINGQLVEEAAIVSFTESGGITTLIIDPVELGFSLDLNDEIVAIGKFNN